MALSKVGAFRAAQGWQPVGRVPHSAQNAPGREPGTPRGQAPCPPRGILVGVEVLVLAQRLAGGGSPVPVVCCCSRAHMPQSTSDAWETWHFKGCW